MTCRIAAALLLATSAAAARADSASFAVDRFQLDPGTYGVLNLAAARVPEQRDLNLGLGLGWANGLLRIERGGITRDLVGSTFGAQLGAALALDGKHELSLVLPLALARDTGSAGRLPAASGAGLGDVRLAGKVLLPSLGRVRLAAALPVTLPTAKKDAFLGEGAITTTPTAIAETTAGPVSVTANLGVAVRPTRTFHDLKVGPAVTWGAGGELPFHAAGLPLTALASLWGEVGLADSGGQARPTELDGAVRFTAPSGLTVTGGLGTALVNGYGAPALRVFALAGWHAPLRRKVAEAPPPPPRVEPPPAPPPAPPPPAREEPPAPPPDPCAAGTTHAPEQCPDLDDDGDGLSNREDRCPLVAGVAAEQGCPAKPPPGPCEAGQAHAPESCPDLDDDGDGVPNGQDRCPLLAGVAEHQGCPPPRAVLTARKIEITEAVFFDSGKDVIQARSFQLLDDIARILEDHPEVKGLSIEGHTDASGAAARNQVLSERRSAAVKVYLVKKGIAPERLEARGFGATRPVVKEVDAAGKAKNRRVEFLVRP
jgi:outer membrane protein OmpA-like peptidoglycan-associated protein